MNQFSVLEKLVALLNNFSTHVYLNSKKIKTAYNIGVGKGVSVQEVVDSFEKTNNIKISYKIGPRRAGDVEEIYSDNSKINTELNWFPVMSFESALKTAWIWEKNK